MYFDRRHVPEKIPEPRLGDDFIRRKDAHAVDFRCGVGFGGEMAPNDLEFLKAHLDQNRTLGSTSTTVTRHPSPEDSRVLKMWHRWMIQSRAEDGTYFCCSLDLEALTLSATMRNLGGFGCIVWLCLPAEYELGPNYPGPACSITRHPQLSIPIQTLVREILILIISVTPNLGPNARRLRNRNQRATCHRPGRLLRSRNVYRSHRSPPCIWPHRRWYVASPP